MFYVGITSGPSTVICTCFAIGKDVCRVWVMWKKWKCQITCINRKQKTHHICTYNYWEFTIFVLRALLSMTWGRVAYHTVREETSNTIDYELLVILLFSHLWYIQIASSSVAYCSAKYHNTCFGDVTSVNAPCSFCLQIQSAVRPYFEDTLVVFRLHPPHQ